MSGTYTNGHSALEQNTKNAVMQVYHGDSVEETENKASGEPIQENTNSYRKQ